MTLSLSLCAQVVWAGDGGSAAFFNSELPASADGGPRSGPRGYVVGEGVNSHVLAGGRVTVPGGAAGAWEAAWVGRGAAFLNAVVRTLSGWGPVVGRPSPPPRSF